MDDVLERLGNLESHVSELRSHVSGLLAVVPHLATKADIGNLKAAMNADVANLRVAIVRGKADTA